MPTVKKDSLIVVGGGLKRKRGHTAGDVFSFYGNFFEDASNKICGVQGARCKDGEFLACLRLRL